MEKSFNFKVGTGITSIFMIFIVLCLTAFGVLSFSAAKADYNLSVKNSQYITNYYDSESKIVEFLAEVDDILYLAKESVEDQEGYLNNIISLFSESDLPIEINIKDLKITGEIHISDKQTLSVEIKINDFSSSERYSVDSLKVNSDLEGFYGEKIAY